jgi:hypothetical protein
LIQRHENNPYKLASCKEAIERLAQLYEEANRPNQAAEWKKKLSETKALLESQTNSVTTKTTVPR